MLESVIDQGLRLVAEAWGTAALVHDRRLVAIDGVRVNNRRAAILARCLGLPRQDVGRKAHQPQALVVSARCVIIGATLAEEIVGHAGSEQACARKLVARLATMGPMLVVLDRGIPARDLVEQMLNHNVGPTPTASHPCSTETQGGRCPQPMGSRFWAAPALASLHQGLSSDRSLDARSRLWRVGSPPTPPVPYAAHKAL